MGECDSIGAVYSEVNWRRLKPRWLVASVSFCIFRMYFERSILYD